MPLIRFGSITFVISAPWSIKRLLFIAHKKDKESPFYKLPLDMIKEIMYYIKQTKDVLVTDNVCILPTRSQLKTKRKRVDNE
jgi:hypothetical protein